MKKKKNFNLVFVTIILREREREIKKYIKSETIKFETKRKTKEQKFVCVLGHVKKNHNFLYHLFVKKKKKITTKI